MELQVRSLFIAFSVVLATATDGHCDWQYTQWGSSPDAVLKASGGAAQLNGNRGKDPAQMKAKLVAPYRAGSNSYLAYFIFDQTDKLSIVDLEMQSGSCPQAVFELTSAYGPPQDRGSFGLKKWWDTKNSNIVIYTDEGSGCTVRYLPLVAAGKPGGL